jgi:hypothetical protein
VKFQEPYLPAMRERAPKMFRELVRHGRMEQHLKQKTAEAYDLLDQLLAHNPNPGLAQRREAEEQVRAVMIDFPPEGHPAQPEPPDDQ